MVRIYLQEIGKYPLLKPDEEIAYARLVQEMIFKSIYLIK